MNILKKCDKYLPIFFLPLGCIGVSSVFQAIGLIVFLYLYLKRREEFDFKLFFQNKIVKKSFIYFSIWIIGMMLSDFISNDNVKESWNWFQRIVPFFLAGLFTIKSDKYFKVFWIGLTLSLMIVSCNVVYNFFIQGHWRPITMFNSPNKLGGFLILLIPFVFGGIYFFKDDLKKSACAIIVLLLGVISLIISGSRGAMLGLILGSFICFIMIQYKKSSNYKFIFKIIMTAFMIMVGLVIIYFLFPAMISRTYDMERVYLWNSAIKMFLDYPIFGVGTGNFNEYYINNGYINPLAKEPNLNTPHNLFLWFLSERGIVTGFPFIIMIFFQAHVLLQNVLTDYKKINIWCCCGVVAVSGMIIHGMVDTVPNNRTYQLMYWLLYGVSCYSIIYYSKNIKG